ncbi:MAG TPA: nitroreductase family protein [Mycobacteriales bacterium]|nr:nitroreductase family protein [Mycobacteriales bacterium]
MTRGAQTSAPLHPLLSERWSPRGFDTDHRLEESQLAALLEAARWSPSASNTQPWRFVVAHRGEAAFERLAATLSGNNRRWAGRASTLLLVLAETTDPEGRPRSYGLYDTGQAVAHLVTQAQAEGLATHQMGGFDKAAAAATFGVDPRFTPVVVVAVGLRQDEHGLPEDLAAREAAPRQRLPLTELVLTGPHIELAQTA